MKRPATKTAIGVATIALLAALAGFRAMRPPRVKVVAVKTEEVRARVHGPGTVQSKVPVTISVKITGIVEKLHADQGDHVKKGQLLAELDFIELKARGAAAQAASGRAQQDLARAKADLLKAQASLELARSNHRRDEEVYKRGYLSAAAFDATRSALRVAESEVAAGKAAITALEAGARQAQHDARAAGELVGYTRIVAPMDGLITARRSEIGSTVTPGTALFQMVDYQIWAASWIDESLIADLRLGQPATITLRSGRVFQGEVARLGNAADTVTREVEVDVKFGKLPDPLVIGEETEVAIETGRRSAPAVPISALLTRENRRGVLVVEDGRARFRPVTISVQDGQRAAVSKGLREGELVIVEPAEIEPGTKVASRPQPATALASE
jgi:HlyD family secretion protein